MPNSCCFDCWISFKDLYCNICSNTTSISVGIISTEITCELSLLIMFFLRSAWIFSWNIGFLKTKTKIIRKKRKIDFLVYFKSFFLFFTFLQIKQKIALFGKMFFLKQIVYTYSSWRFNLRLALIPRQYGWNTTRLKRK